jgi:hypothetical protein
VIARAAAFLCATFFTLGVSGCAANSTASAPCGEALGDPERLLELARAADAERNVELTYRYIALIHILHPGSGKSREVFPLAARAYRLSWAPHRTELDSIWVTSEPRFMIAWLAGFFQDGQPFPQEQMDALFVGMNYGLFREFLAYAQNHPRISQWEITAEKDNGIVEKVSGSRR